jgi:flagellar motor switch/type III secretory pathway protein FliN
LYQEELYQYTNPVVVVLSKPWSSYTPDEQLLLQKILTSVKLSVDAVQVVTRVSLSLKSLASLSPGRVLIFGAHTEEEIVLYQQTPAQGFIVIKADDLTQLDDTKKKNLWNALRQMFAV